MSEGVGADEWVSFVDVRGETELVSLPAWGAGGGAKPSPPTVEPLLARGRLLGVDEGQLTLVTANSRGWSLARVTCAR